MKPIKSQVSKKPWLGWVLFLATMIVVFFLGLLASNIIERRAEATFANAPKVKLSQFEPRNEVWGENFQREFQSYWQTADTSFKSLYGGNAMIDMLELYPDLVILWAGYGFSKDYNQGRGHYYAIDDIRNTLRTGAPVGDEISPMPNTCWTCKSTDVPRMMNQVGIADFYAGSWETKGSEIVNTIGCADCHDAETMNLRISRPALIEAYERSGKDITKVSYQEMRSLVCAQCHVEYYFDKRNDKKSYLTFPWDKGSSMEDMEKYYDEFEFYDWIHPLSKTHMIKAQHPDFEVFKTGIHADRGVACADCHLPYQNEGGQKFTNHKMQSPLNNISGTCQVCHRESEESLRENVYERQKKIAEIRTRLENLLVRSHIEAKVAIEAGATDEDMKPIQKLIRQAQWRWDFASAGHGNSFHSPLETSRIISMGIDKVQESRLLISQIFHKYNVKQPIPMPDISSKVKAQEYIGLDVAKLKSNKQQFIEKVVPKWLEEAKKRESTYKKVII